MANYSNVNAGDTILAAHPNNLFLDITDTSTGHVHDGTNAKSNVDDSTIEISGGNYQLKDDGTTGAKLDPAVAGDGIKQDGSGNLNVEPADFAGTGLEDDGSDNIQIANGGVGANKLGVGATANAPVTRYYSISPTELHPSDSNYADTTKQEYGTQGGSARSADTTTIRYCAGVHLPHGAIVTSLKVWWYRDDASSAGTSLLNWWDLSESKTEMANADTISTAGEHTSEDTSITDATIDNSSRTYDFQIALSLNDSANDVYFLGAVITYTTTDPF